MSEVDIEIEVPKLKTLTVSLAGETYSVLPLKGAVGLMLSREMRKAGDDQDKVLAVMEKMNKLIFPAKDLKRVNERLLDPSDELDTIHVMQLTEALIERAAGNPTT